MIVLLDDKSFYTGTYAKTGNINGGVKIDNLPPSDDINMQMAYKCVDKTKEVVSQIPIFEKYIILEDESERIVTDEEIEQEQINEINIFLQAKTGEDGDELYEDIVKTILYKDWEFDEDRYNEITNNNLEIKKDELVLKSKQLLEEYLSKNTLTSSCHATTPAKYSITMEKQTLLNKEIMLSVLAQQASVEYQCSWNATGKACTYDWTLEELQQLAFEMTQLVKPLISKQQAYEEKINSCTNLEELEDIIIDYSV